MATGQNTEEVDPMVGLRSEEEAQELSKESNVDEETRCGSTRLSLQHSRSIGRRILRLA